jgi:predicted naringenin-chalcone synthase
MKHLVRFATSTPYTGANQELKTLNKFLQKNEVRHKRIDRNLHSSSKIMTNYSEVNLQCLLEEM